MSRRVVLDADALAIYFSKKQAELKGRKRRAVEIMDGLHGDLFARQVDLYVTDLVVLEFLPGVWKPNRRAAQEFISMCNRISMTSGDTVRALAIFREMFDKGYRRGSVTDLLNSFYAANLDGEVFGLDGCYKIHSDFFEKETEIKTYKLTID